MKRNRSVLTLSVGLAVAMILAAQVGWRISDTVLFGHVIGAALLVGGVALFATLIPEKANEIVQNVCLCWLTVALAGCASGIARAAMNEKLSVSGFELSVWWGVYTPVWWVLKQLAPPLVGIMGLVAPVIAAYILLRRARKSQPSREQEPTPAPAEIVPKAMPRPPRMTPQLRVVGGKEATRPDPSDDSSPPPAA